MKKLIMGILTITAFFMLGCNNIPISLDEEAESVKPLASEEYSTGTEMVELQEFEPQSGKYSIAIPEIEGGWTVYPNPGNEEMLVLDNEDMTFSILIQSFPKVSDAYSDFTSFEAFYRDNMTASMGEGVAEELQIKNVNILQSSTMYYEVESQGYLFKGQITVFEMENEYYSCTLTGMEEVYDMNIKTYEGLYDTFTEE